MIYYSYKTDKIKEFSIDVFQDAVPVGSIGFGVLDKPFIWVGQKFDFVHQQIAKRAQFQELDTQGAGGTAVVSPGSIMIIYLGANQTEVEKFIRSVFEFLAKKLAEQNIICHHENNDLVLTKGNRKLCGYSFGNTSRGHLFGGLYINIHVNNKMITEVCTKHREPFGLSEYNITTAKVEQWFKEFWANQSFKSLD